jgi:hypothetical protein
MWDFVWGLQFGFVGVAASGLTRAAAFFLDFPEGRLGAVANLIYDFETWPSACCRFL